MMDVVWSRWWGIVQKVVDLEAFKESVLFELFRSHELLSRKWSEETAHVEDSSKMLMQAWQSHGRAEWSLRDHGTVCKKIKELVDLQVEVLNSRQSVATTERFIKDRPDIVVNRILSHIQYLFEVKTVDGILPRLNQVYVFNEEMKNFMTALRAALGRSTSTAQAIVIEEALHQLAKVKLNR